jgi:3-oxoacyl-[acyl-carrier protein] reductase
MNLDGARCLVAGGSRGLGRVLAIDLAEHGADVALSYFLSEESARQTCEGIRELGRTCLVVQADLSRSTGAADLVRRAGEGLGGLDALVYAASGPFVPTPAAELDAVAWAASFDTIARGFFFAAQAAHRLFVADALAGDGEPPERGVIIAITDVGGGGAGGGPPAPPAPPTPAQIATLKALAKAWGADGVRVCGVAPGPLDTPDDRRREASVRAAGRTLLGRLQRPEEVAAAVRFCLENRYVTGQNLIVDGGYLLR